MASKAGDPNKIDAADMKKLREKKKSTSEKNAKKEASMKVKSARKYLKKKDGA
jgi:transposase